MGFCLPNTNGEMVSAFGAIETARGEMREHESEMVDSKQFVKHRTFHYFKKLRRGEEDIKTYI